MNSFIITILNNKKTFIRKANGSTFLEVGKKDMRIIEFKVPTIDEQDAIALLLSVIDKDISMYNQEIEVQKHKKKALMQLLLTGKVRVKHETRH